MIIEQRSAEWFEMRKGRITSSEIYKIMGKGDLTETAKTYLLEKVCELYGGVTEPAVGAALTWGTELEPVAIAGKRFSSHTSRPRYFRRRTTCSART